MKHFARFIILLVGFLACFSITCASPLLSPQRLIVANQDSVYAKIAELYLNICDTTGKESLFQAEMHRAQKLITHLKELQAHEFAFIILDEIFTATNTTEGIAGAYGIAKKITRYNQCCYLIATHFLKLTELEQDTQEIYKNYQIRVCKNSDGSFIYLYTLKPGINDQAIALELLKQEGFDPDILEEAYKILGQS